MQREANIVAKAARLYLEDRVRPVAGEVFLVEGDHSTYLVAVTEDMAVCSCPARGECSHLLASRRAARDTEDARRDLEECFPGTDPADDLELRGPWGAAREDRNVNSSRAAANGRERDQRKVIR